jgi:hypothetical protein
MAQRPLEKRRMAAAGVMLWEPLAGLDSILKPHWNLIVAGNAHSRRKPLIPFIL